MRLAAIDIGLKRIGVALCLHQEIIVPHEAVLRHNRDQAAKEVTRVLQEWKIECLVVGLPKNGSSAEEMQRRIEHFVGLLDFQGVIVYQDEYGSSMEAKEMMQGVVKQKRDGRIDSLAASIILERYLFSQKNHHG